MILGIDVSFIHVKNPEMMTKWYEEKLGLDILYKTPDLGWQEFTFPENPTPTRFALDYGGPNPSEVESQSIIISFKVANIESAVRSLEENGVEFYGKNKIHDVGPTLVAIFCDPEGNWMQLSQRKE